MPFDGRLFRTRREILATGFPVEVNKHSPQNDSLELWYSATKGRVPIEHKHRRPITYSSGATVDQSLLGPAGNFPADHTAQVDVGSDQANWDGLTLTAWITELKDPGPFFDVAFGISGSTTQYVVLIPESATNWTWFGRSTTASDISLNIGNLTYPVHVALVLPTLTAPTAVAYVNGVEHGTDAGANTYDDLFGTGAFGLGWGGAGFGAARDDTDVSIADARVYSRGLSAQEVWQLYDPDTRWDLHSLPRLFQVKAPAAGGGNPMPLALIEQGLVVGATHG